MLGSYLTSSPLPRPDPRNWDLLQAFPRLAHSVRVPQVPHVTDSQVDSLPQTYLGRDWGPRLFSKTQIPDPDKPGECNVAEVEVNTRG